QLALQHGPRYSSPFPNGGVDSSNRIWCKETDMPRGIRSALTISQLERLLNVQRSAVNKLVKKRTVIQRKLDAIDRDIAKLGGSGGSSRNDVSLPAAMEAALKKNGTMKVGEIVDAVQ